jgi:hypothetical protein
MTKVGYTEGVFVKVDPGTKQRMKELKLNWSHEIREFIVMRVKMGRRKKNLARAVAGTDRLFREAGDKSFDSVTFIRKMRDARYGPNSDRR